MLRTRFSAKALSTADRDAALDLCARDRARHVFVAARILEARSDSALSGLLGHWDHGVLTSICWSSANVVPVETDDESRADFAERMRRWRGSTASILGPSEEVLDLWRRLEPTWGPARAVRATQPLMTTRTRPSALGTALDERVRPALPSEVDAVVPAAAHMFTHEIGYPPYSGSSRAYRSAVGALIARGHTYVVVEDGTVIFKADVGSLALGCAQVQGVWLAPHLRGAGRSAALLGSVVEQILAGGVEEVSLYVNDYNTAARALYARLGFTTVGSFTTVLL